TRERRLSGRAPGLHPTSPRGSRPNGRHAGVPRPRSPSARPSLMRVLHVDPEPAWGGGETQVLALLAELAARDVTVRLAAHPDGPLARAAAARGVPLVPLRVRHHLDLRAALALRRLVPGHDVVHFHTARAHALAPLCRGRGARLVVTPRMDHVPTGGPYAPF